MEEIKLECVKRLKILELDKEIIDNFSTSDTIYVSSINGEFSKITEEHETIKSLIENKKDIVIYHMVQDKNITYCLYVTKNKEQWKSDKSDMTRGFADVIYYNKAFEEKVIGIETSAGKIVRVV